VRVGMEATGYSRWFERLLAELGFELWIGDPAEIKVKRVKKQKYENSTNHFLEDLDNIYRSVTRTKPAGGGPRPAALGFCSVETEIAGPSCL
jgi:hypothetical protein